jgi:hypothetical protein
MGFIKHVIIYERNEVKVYINQCHATGKKTKVFAIRKDDNTGLAEYMGGITFNPRWRQYVFEPEIATYWSSGCMKNITSFIDDLNMKWRKKHSQKG